jgi:hypothetical protein
LSSRERSAILLLCRWRKLIEATAALSGFDPSAPEVARLLPELVELADETDRFIDDTSDRPEASA